MQTCCVVLMNYKSLSDRPHIISLANESERVKVFATLVIQYLDLADLAVLHLDDPDNRIFRVLQILEQVFAGDEVYQRRDRI